MTKVFVVTYQSYLYGEEVYDYKNMMMNPFDVKGVFSTEEIAKDFIKKSMFDEMKDYYGEGIDELPSEECDIDINEDDHWQIWDLEIDKNK